MRASKAAPTKLVVVFLGEAIELGDLSLGDLGAYLISVSTQSTLGVPQIRTRLDAKFVPQHLPGRLVGSERIRLPAAAVQRNHQLLAKPLAQRIRGHQRLQFADHAAVPACGEIGFDPFGPFGIVHHADPVGAPIEK